MSMPGSIDPPGQAQGQAPIIMNQESLRYLGAVIAESVTKSQDLTRISINLEVTSKVVIVLVVKKEALMQMVIL